MLQEVFRIPYLNIPIYGYGLMMVIGFLVLIQVAQRLARQKGLNPEIFMNAALLALVSGIAGARISHILENLNEFTNPNLSTWDNFINMINIRSGGLTYYGGFLLATPALIIYAIVKKVPLKVGMDIVAICVLIGLGFGRIGCFLNGCCYGDQCLGALGVRFPYYSNAYVEQFAKPELRKLLNVPRELQYRVTPNPGNANDDGWRLLRPEQARAEGFGELIKGQKALPVHPAELYSSVTAFLLAILLWSYWTLSPAPGKVFALLLILEGGTRFLLEMLRVEPAVLGAFSLSMLIGAGMVFVGGILWFLWGKPSPQVDSMVNKKVPGGSPAT
jgi:phosphatidylglycerol---prolipoprotein diacylglyceryl transferase